MSTAPIAMEQAVRVAGTWTLAIDFGTTATVVAVGDDRGARLVEIDGERSVPSTVAWVDGRLRVGVEAERQRVFRPGAAAMHPKRSLGRRPNLLLGQNPVAASEAVGELLRVAVEAAVGDQKGRQPAASVLTHPVRWSTPQLDALLEAGRVAGLSEPNLVAEPIAAALHFGLGRLDVGQHIAVYDLGGGTFDTAVLTRASGGFELAGPPGGNENIGGDDFDSRLTDLLIERIAAHSAVWADELRDSTDPVWRRALAELTLEARRVKETLSRQTTSEVVLPAPMSGEVRVTRPELEALVHDDLARTVEELVATVERAGLDTSDLAATYVTGGASRTPLVTRLLHDALGTAPDTLDDPKAVVALGATQWPATSSPSGDSPDEPAPVDAPSAESKSMVAATPGAPPPPSPTPSNGGGRTAVIGGAVAVAVAVAVVAVAVIAVVVILLTRGSGPAARTTIPVAGAPLGLTFTGGSLWATVDEAGTATRIDVGSNKVRADVAVGSTPLGVTHTDDAIWVADQDANVVVRVDPATNAVEARVPVGKGPIALAAGGGAVWVANVDAGSVSKIDDGTNRVVATIAVGRGPSAVAVGEGAVWVTNGTDGTVTRIDPDSNTVEITLPVGSQPLAVVTGGRAVWIANYDDDSVSRIDPDRNEVTGSVAVGDGPAALALDGSELWVANSLADTVVRVDTGNGRVVGTTTSGRGPAALAIGDGSLWVANSIDKSVGRLPLG